MKGSAIISGVSSSRRFWTWSHSLSDASGLFGDFPAGFNTRSLDRVRQRYRPSSIWTPALLLSQLNSLHAHSLLLFDELHELDVNIP